MQVRQVRLADLPSVSAIMTAVGWRAYTEERWQRDVQANPALAPGDPASPGWVLEHDDRIVGFIGNLIQRYHWAGRLLRAATAWGYIVAPEGKPGALRLVQAFASQPQVDLLLATTATLHVPQVLGLFRFERLPQPDYDVAYYWITHTRGLLAARLRRGGLPAGLAALAAWPAAPLLWLEGRARGRRPRPPAGDVRIERLGAEQVGEEFDALWRRKLAQTDRLISVRNGAVLRWQFSPRLRDVPPVLLAARRGDGLVAYAALLRGDRPEVGLRRIRIADLLALDDDPLAIRALLAAAWRHAARERVHMLELDGLPAHIRRIARESAPRPWRKPAFPFLFRATDPALHAALGSEDRWYTSLLDGDGAFS
jgi:hypothetical protein